MLQIDSLERRSLVLIQAIGDIQHGYPIIRESLLSLPLDLLDLLFHLGALYGDTLIRLAVGLRRGGGIIVIDEGSMGAEVFYE